MSKNYNQQMTQGGGGPPGPSNPQNIQATAQTSAPQNRNQFSHNVNTNRNSSGGQHPPPPPSQQQHTHPRGPPNNYHGHHNANNNHHHNNLNHPRPIQPNYHNQHKGGTASTASANPAETETTPCIDTKLFESIEYPFCTDHSKYEQVAKIGQGTFG